ncbi:MAG: hypothetical protein GXN93_01010 [Candidatus Diapherotrites archaeon]|nr:hypothetical protein [Candidatus Diapherotrites archaeon]
MDTVVVEFPRDVWVEVVRAIERRGSEDSYRRLREALLRAPAVGVNFERKEAHRY